jgi:hypothetical protein
MEPEASLLGSQELVTGPYPGPFFQFYAIPHCFFNISLNISLLSRLFL